MGQTIITIAVTPCYFLFSTLIIYLYSYLPHSYLPHSYLPHLPIPAVLFYNLLADGNGDDLAVHAALPVYQGEKWLANFWVWDPRKSF